MMIRPLHPLIFPSILILLIVIMASVLPLFSSIDSAIIGLVQSLPDTWQPAALLVTSLGDHWFLVGVAAVVSVWELLRRQYVRSLVMALSTVAMPLFYTIKQLVERARPVSDFVIEQGLHGYSFPSGHATGSAAVYGMIALLAYSHLVGIWRYVVSGLCLLLLALIGLTRIYLGAHFPSDVLAGWLVALIVISLLRSLSLYIAKKKPEPAQQAIEDTTEDPAPEKNV